MKSKEYVRPMPAAWWMHNYHLTLFLIRELTSVFVAGYAILLLVLLYRFGQGREAFQAFFATLQSPLSVVLQLLALVFVVFHSATTFNAAPVLMVVRRGEDKVDPALIVGANYILWLILSALIFVLAVR
jgi:fumarate reductase subunit C